MEICPHRTPRGHTLGRQGQWAKPTLYRKFTRESFNGSLERYECVKKIVCEVLIHATIRNGGVARAAKRVPADHPIYPGKGCSSPQLGPAAKLTNRGTSRSFPSASMHPWMSWRACTQHLKDPMVHRPSRTSRPPMLIKLAPNNSTTKCHTITEPQVHVPPSPRQPPHRILRLDGRLKHQLIVDLQNEPARRQRRARAPLKAGHRALDDVCRGTLGDAVERGPLCSAAGPAVGAGQIWDRPPIASQCLLVWWTIGQRKMSVGESLKM